MPEKTESLPVFWPIPARAATPSAVAEADRPALVRCGVGGFAQNGLPVSNLSTLHSFSNFLGWQKHFCRNLRCLK